MMLFSGFIPPPSALSREALYGTILGPYLDDPSNIFIASSDFCHWGQRFNYSYYDESKGPIWKSIQWLDKTAMEAIETVSGVLVEGSYNPVIQHLFHGVHSGINRLILLFHG
jgi:predicted class III extradiol MEMO1 family dioxygenase